VFGLHFLTGRECSRPSYPKAFSEARLNPLLKIILRDNAFLFDSRGFVIQAHRKLSSQLLSLTSWQSALTTC
jgi:hypothetical protein